MPDDTKGEKPATQQNESKPPKGDDTKGEKPATAGSKQPAAPIEAPAPKPRNLTREQLEGFLASRAVADGANPRQAADHAKRRAVEMIPHPEEE